MSVEQLCSFILINRLGGKLMNRQDNIRNFSIIAHIDHGKSTLADRLLEFTGALTQREMQAQILDNMELERERGITIKARAVKLIYKAKDGKEYELNLIDTPGHVDFNYEVSRSLAACEGAVLVVDAAQGIEAQTLANTYLAMEHDLEIVPVINKIDLPSARPDEVKQEIEDVIGIDGENAPLISAKNGINIEEVLEKIVELIPPPAGDEDAPLKALIFDSYYDAYKGVIVYVRIIDGKLKSGQRIKMMATGSEFDVVDVGYLHPNGLVSADEISAGEVGFITASIKNVQDVHVGDTVTTSENGAEEALPGYKEVKSMVYSGIYPADGARYDDLREALEKLQLNDAALNFEAETSVALGFGFRCGFLGLLHMEIIQERLEREFNLDLVTTAPSVEYKVIKTDGTILTIDNPTNLPDVSEIDYMEEPIVRASILSPKEYVGSIMELCQDRRGTYIDMEYLDETRVQLNYFLPLNEIIYDFFDALKSRTRGYASFDYEFERYERSDLVKLDMLLNGEMVDALSFIVHSDRAYSRGRRMAEKLKEVIPRQLFEVPIQAAVGGKIIARETVKAMRKDVLAKCYGGDISRKRKLLEKQKEGKKRMRQVGSVEVPQEAFMSVLKLDE
jgi:GTP-binding protein lepA